MHVPCTVLHAEPNYSRALCGSNTFGTVKICLRQGYFELMSVNHSASSGGIIGIYFHFSCNMKLGLMSTNNIPFSI